MELYHYFFNIIRIIILLLVLLMGLKIIPIQGKYFVLIQTIFKIFIGLFMIIYFSKKDLAISADDKAIIISSGIILIITIDYSELITKFRNDE